MEIVIVCIKAVTALSIAIWSLNTIRAIAKAYLRARFNLDVGEDL